MGYNTFTNEDLDKDVISIVYQNKPAQVEGRRERQTAGLHPICPGRNNGLNRICNCISCIYYDG